MATAPLGFGIIGTGMIAGYHAQAIRALQGARLVGVQGRDAERTQTFAREHGASLATTQLEELLSHPEIQVVCVTTPSGAHREPTLAALAAGRVAVVEKPLEITLARVDEVLEASRRTDVPIVPIFQSRFGAGARLVQAAVAGGRLGRLVSAAVAVKWHRAPSYYQGWKGTLALDGGGAVINQSIHGLDLLQWLVGLPEEVFAWTTRRVHTGIQAEDTATASLRWADGALGSFEATTAAWPGWSRRIELCGEHGSVALEDDRITKWDFQHEMPGDREVRSAPPEATGGSGAGAANSITFLNHQRQLQDLVDAIAQGRAPLLTGPDGRGAVALVEAIYTSAREGRPIIVSKKP